MTLRLLPLLASLFCTINLSSQNYLMDGTPIDDCQGFFMDSGGNSNTYGPNENFTTTICPDGSSGTHIQLLFSGVDIAAGDNLCFFDGVDATGMPLGCAADFDPGAPFIVQSTAVNTSGCVTLTFTSDATLEAQGWSADINCIAACQQIEAVLVSTDPIVSPADTGWIDICPGEGIQFEGAGLYPQNGAVYPQSDLTSEFIWDFGDGTFGSGPSAYKIYNEPGGYIVQLIVQDAIGCRNSNFLSQRVRVSTYPDFELGDVPTEICLGDTLNLSAAVAVIDTNFEVSVNPTIGSFQTSGVRSDSLPLPDGNGTSYSTSIMFTNFAPGQVLTDINDLLSICVNMEHSWMFDLEINLTCPDGTMVILQNQQSILNETFLGIPYELDDFGGSFPPIQGEGMDYCWTPTSTNGTWTEYVDNFDPPTLPELDYESFEPLTDFLGCPLNGEWIITVIDKWESDNGWIFNWSINFADHLFPDIEQFTPQIVDFSWVNNPSIFYDSQDSIAASPLNAGVANYTFEVTDDFGCTNDTTVLVNVLPYAHPNCYVCEGELDVLNDTTICGGQSIALDATLPPNLTPQESVYETLNSFTFDHIIAPPSIPLESTISISSYIPNLLTDATMQIASVCIDISHSYDEDIDVFLQAPGGQIMELTTDNGGSGNNYTMTCFTPSATNDITMGTSPFTGDFIPEGNWDDLNLSPINGDWQLLVSDDQSGFSGTLNSWSIAFALPNNVMYSWNTNADLSCLDCPDPIATPTASTSYVVEVTDNFNCVRTDTINIEVSPGFPAPDLSCAPIGNDGVIFTWLPVTGATTYEISLDGGTTWQAPNGLLEHSIFGLGVNEMVTLQVRVVSMSVGCDAGIAETTCNSLGCMLAIDTILVTHPSCPNIADGAILLSSSMGLSPVNYFIDGAGPNAGPTINGISEGMLQVIGVDNIGCRDTIDLMMVATGEALNLTFDIDSVSCNGNTNGTATVSVDGGSGNFSYLWNTFPSINTPMATGLAPGMYTVIVTDLGGCSATEMVSIVEPEVLQVQITPTDVLCNAAANGSALAQGSGGTAPYSFEWSNSQSGDMATLLDVGGYTVTITDVNGCSTTNTIMIGEPAPIQITADSLDATCAGNIDGQLFCVFGGTTGNVSFEWSGPGGYTSTQQNPVGVASGVYCVTIVDGNGCIANACTEINEPTAILLGSDVTPTLCADSQDGTATVMPSGGSGNFTYVWSDTNNQDTPTAINLASGNYTVTVSDQNNCSTTIDVFVPQANPIQLDLNSTETSCFNLNNGTATAMASGGVGQLTFQWGANAANQTTAVAGNLAVGNYCVVVSDENNCTVTECIDVTSPTALLIDDINETPVACFGENNGQALANVSGGAVGNYNFLWSDSNAQTINPAINLSAGTYTLTVTDVSGCTAVESVVVSEPDTLMVGGTATNIACFGGTDGMVTAALNGGTAPFMYEWNNGQTDIMATDLSTGMATITVTDANGCTGTAEFLIDQPSTPVSVTIDQTFIGCYGEQQGIALATGMGGTGVLTYQWDNGAGTDATANDLDAIEYNVTVSDENACVALASIDIQTLDSIELNLATVLPSCHGTSDGKVAVNFITRGGQAQDLADYMYEWSSPTSPDQPIIENLLGDQSYSVTVSDMIGCIATLDTQLDQPQKIQLTLASTDAICFGMDDGTATVVSAQGTHNEYTYQWGTNASSQTTAVADSLFAGIYSVTVTDSIACSVDTMITVGQPDRIRMTFDVENNFCTGDSLGNIETSVTGGIPNYTFEWSTGADSANLSDLATGKYFVTLTDGQDCISFDSVSVTQPVGLSIDPIATDPSCVGDRDGRLEVEVTGGAMPYQFSLDGENYLGTNVLIGLTAGAYEVFVRDANDCVNTAFKTLVDPPEFMVDAGEDVELELGDSTQLNPSFENNSGQVQLSWSAPYEGTLSCPIDTLPCFDPMVQTLNTITYELYGVDEMGCEATDEVKIEILKSRNIFVPTAFTPNGDNANNLLLVHGKEGTKVVRFKVYDRWGGLVYERGGFLTNDESIGWDGTYRGVNVNTGVYVWVVEVEFQDGYEEVYHGNTTLLR